jgi:hypothetical protein
LKITLCISSSLVTRANNIHVKMAKFVRSHQRIILNAGCRLIRMAANNEAPISEDIGGFKPRFLLCVTRLIESISLQL